LSHSLKIGLHGEDLLDITAGESEDLARPWQMHRVAAGAGDTIFLAQRYRP
jgi:hypothetical protein